LGWVQASISFKGGSGILGSDPGMGKTAVVVAAMLLDTLLPGYRAEEQPRWEDPSPGGDIWNAWLV